MQLQNYEQIAMTTNGKTMQVQMSPREEHDSLSQTDSMWKHQTLPIGYIADRHL
jgi:hypothetical protein